VDCQTCSQSTLHLYSGRAADLMLAPVVILRTPTDIFPNINIPVIAVAWQYTGLNPQEMEGRITTVFERVLTTLVDNIEHIESVTINGQAFVKIYLQPNASLDTANAEVTAVSQSILRQLPGGYAATIGLQFQRLVGSHPATGAFRSCRTGPQRYRPELPENPACHRARRIHSVPLRRQAAPDHGRSQPGAAAIERAVGHRRNEHPGITRSGVALGTVKIDQFEYDVDLNASPTKVDRLNDLPIKVVGNSTFYLRDVAHVRDGFRSANQYRAAGRPARCAGYRAEGRQCAPRWRRIRD
jgi:hypothetical protein